MNRTERSTKFLRDLGWKEHHITGYLLDEEAKGEPPEKTYALLEYHKAVDGVREKAGISHFALSEARFAHRADQATHIQHNLLQFFDREARKRLTPEVVELLDLHVDDPAGSVSPFLILQR